MKKFTLTILLMSIIISMISQTQITFEKTYGGINDDVGTSVIQTSDGGYMIAGYTSSYGMGGNDIYLIRTDEYGDTIWTNTIGGINDDYAYSMIESQDSGFVIWGKTKSYGLNEDNFYLLKVNSLGDTLWTRTFTGYNSPSYIKTSGLFRCSDNGYILTGTKFPSGNYIKGYVIKTDSAGNEIWDFHQTNSSMYAGLEAPDSTYLFIGRVFIGTKDMYLLNLNTTGTNFVGTYNYDYNNDYGEGFSVISSMQGGYLLSGFSGSLKFVHIVKVDSAFNIQWETLFNYNELYVKSTPNGEKDFFNIQTADSCYMFLGRNTAFGDIKLIKTDSSANIMWSQLIGGTEAERPYCFQQTSDNGFVIVGLTESYGAGGKDVYLIKTDSSGAVLTSNFHKDYNNNISVSIYPNPTTGKINVEAEGIERIDIYDIQGMKVKSQKTNIKSQKYELDLSTQPKGIYIIKVTTSKGVAVEKIVLE